MKKIYLAFLLTFTFFSSGIFAQQWGNALDFDGTNDYVSLSNQVSYGTTFTQEMWIYPTDASTTRYSAILGTYTPHDYPRHPSVYQYGKKIHFGFGNGTVWYNDETGDVLTINTWNHVAVTFNGTNYLVYVNGSLMKTSACASGKTPNAAVLPDYIGNSYTEYFKGKIDEVRIWNIVRTQAEIYSNMTAPLSGTEIGLLAYYKFNQGTAGANNTGITTLPDVKGNNNGTLQNYTLTGTTSNWVASDIPVTSPVVTSVFVPVNGTYSANQNLDFTVNFSVAVNVAGGTPSIPVTLNTGGTVAAAYMSGTGTSALVFRYVVVSGNADPDGIVVGTSIALNGATIMSASNQNANLTLNSIGNTTGVLVDATAKITVTATAGTSAGSYNTLNQAFNAINAGTHSGFIQVKIDANTTETASAVLNASGSGSAIYTSVLLYPTVSGLSISGDLAAPLIDLNGADNVTIDGRVNQTGATDLVISNASTSATGGTSTIRFINDATGNAVKYCTIKGSETAGGCGIIFFSTTSGTSGNSNNTIDHNNITNAADANRPLSAIYSLGTVAGFNSGNTISNNNIYNFFNRGNSSSGIYLGYFTSAWTITGNSFYETTSFTPTANVIYHCIIINNIDGINFTLTGNYIGGSAAECGGSKWTKTNATDNTFYGIWMTVGSATASNVQGNTIKNFSWSNSGKGSWVGINMAAGSGRVNIGTATGNIIGEATGNGSITYTGEANGANVKGINIVSDGNVDCQNNTIGSITTSYTLVNTNSANIYGIYKFGGGITNISNNTIGSTDASTSNSINASSASSGSTQKVCGIYSACYGTTTLSGNTVSKMTNATTNATAGTTGYIWGIYVGSSGTNTITNNTVRDLTIANANNTLTLWDEASVSVGGIVFENVSAKLQTITGNTIYNLSNTFPSFTGGVIGLYYMGGTTASTVNQNFIHSLKVSSGSTGASIYGIRIIAGATTYSNNIISLGSIGGTSIDGTHYGIYETGAASNNNNLYFNTVYLSGVPTSGASNSYALYSEVTTNTRNFRNNIFSNARSNSGATGKHYAAWFNYSVTTSLTLGYNDYYAPGTGGVLGRYNNSDVTTVPLIAGLDVGSSSMNPVFASAGGTTASNYIPSASLPGISGTGIITDFTGATRAAPPEMGAWEQAASFTWTGASSTNWSTAGNWSFIIVPIASSNVIIPSAPSNQPHITSVPGSPSICNNLTIASGSELTIDAGKALTINGTLTNNAGNSGLVIHSGGSLLNNTTGVAAKVERAIAANEWHLISPPISDAISNTFLGKYLQTHTESTNVYTDIIPTTDPLTPMKGYALWGDASGFTTIYSGTLNAGTQSFSTTYSGVGNGWNLVGNPYPSSIDWDAAGWTKSNVNAATYIHVNAATWASYVGSAGANGGSRYIAPGQGFFVQASAAGSLAMTNAVRVHNTTTFFKHSEAVHNLIRLQVSGNGYKDEAVLRFLPESSAEFDGDYDAYKFFGDVAEAPQIYTLGNIPLSINSLPETNTVAVGVKAGATGTYTIAATEIIDLQFVALEDTKTGIFTELSAKPYTFNFTAGDNEQRFKLHFSALSVPENQAENVTIYSYQKTVYINLGENVKGDVYIYNIAGQLISSKPSSVGMNEIGLQNTGNYIVKVITKNNTVVRKVFIQ